MGVGIQSPFRSRERILGFGNEGTGKSSALLYIARAVLPTGARFWIIDNDNTYDRLLETDFIDISEHPGLLFAGDGFGGDPYEWKGTAESIKYATEHMGVDDWLVIDFGDKLWAQVQEWFTGEVFHATPEDYLLALRQSKTRKKDGGADVNLGVYEGFMDWPVINTEYHARVSRPVLRSRGHLFWVAQSQGLDKQDDKQTQEVYGAYGSRPQGQKGSRHAMQTVVAFGRKRSGELTLESMKDRGRGLWMGEGYGELDKEGIVRYDFSKKYLVETAGWKRVMVKG
jgi:hypothetical protein